MRLNPIYQSILEVFLFIEYTTDGKLYVEDHAKMPSRYKVWKSLFVQSPNLTP